jgi:MIP family channel proteins
MDQEPLHRGFAEFVGTFALVFVSAGAGLVSLNAYGPFFGAPQALPLVPGSFGLVAVALAYGLVVAAMASALGHISGGHFNPAITLGFLLNRRIAPTLAVVYWLLQFGAAALAALLLRWIFTDQSRNVGRLGAPEVASSITNWKAVVIEAILTFFLVWVVFATAADPRGAFKQIAGLAIGLTITVDVLVGGPLTGGMMNPARAFGPQLVQKEWTDWWVWYLGPFAGAAIAALVYEFLYLTPRLRPLLPVGPPETGVAETAPGEAAVE